MIVKISIKGIKIEKKSLEASWKLYTGSFPYLVSISLYCQSCNETVWWDVHTNSFLLTIWIFCWLYTHVGFTFLHARLPLSAFFFQRSLSTTFCVDVGKVRRRVMVGLHGLIVLYLKCDQYGLIAPLDDFRLDITVVCIRQVVVTQTKLFWIIWLIHKRQYSLSLSFYKLEPLP